MTSFPFGVCCLVLMLWKCFVAFVDKVTGISVTVFPGISVVDGKLQSEMIVSVLKAKSA